MTNSEAFHKIFNKYATEIWAAPEDEFLRWLNADFTARWEHVLGVATPGGDPYYECSFCKHGRCYGVEHPRPLEKVCPTCGAIMKNVEE